MKHQEAPATEVIILGMHRSGTSCLAGSLQEAGLYLGDVNESAPANAKGNRENRSIMDLNEEVLTANGGSWHEPPDTVVWNPEQKARKDELIEAYPASKSWGFKDPRTLLTLEGWLETLPAARCVGTFRHPEAVARSLRARNRFSRKKCFSLWMTYNFALLEHQRRLNFDLVCFDWSADDYSEKLVKIAANLDQNLDLHKIESLSFFEPALRNDEMPRDDEIGLSKMLAKFTSAGRIPEPVMAMYRTLEKIAG